jgi:hypothetical protein
LKKNATVERLAEVLLNFVHPAPDLLERAVDLDCESISAFVGYVSGYFCDARNVSLSKSASR